MWCPRQTRSPRFTAQVDGRQGPVERGPRDAHPGHRIKVTTSFQHSMAFDDDLACSPFV